jgi:hypothetical protein
MDENVYFNALGPTLIQVNDQFLTVDEWKSNEENVKGYDANSICADPLFVDAENHDYRLREDSPARKLGIESIETENIGCSDYWKE